MEFYVLETPNYKEGIYSLVHSKTFHGSCEPVPLFCSKNSVENSACARIPIVVRSGHFFPPIFGDPYLIVNETVKVILDIQ